MYRTHRQYLKGDLARMWMKNTSNTGCLIYSDTTDGSTVFTDSGYYGLSGITAQGNAQHSTDQQKFGTTSIKFAGAGDYVDLGTPGLFGVGENENWSLDFWFYYASGTTAGFFGKQNTSSSNHTLLFLDNTNDLHWHHKDDSESLDIEIDALGEFPAVVGWYHIALGRTADQIRLYLNGIQIGDAPESGAIPYNFISGNIVIGEVKDDNGTYSTNGYIDQFRYVEGENMFPTNFIPPRGPYT